MDTSTGVVALVPYLRPGGKSVFSSVELALQCPEIVKVYLLTYAQNAVSPLEQQGATVLTLDEIKEPQTKELNSKVLKSFVNVVEILDGETYRYLLVLNPAMSQQSPMAVMECYQWMMINGDKAGIIDVQRSLHLIRIDDLKENPFIADTLERHMTYENEHSHVKGD